MGKASTAEDAKGAEKILTADLRGFMDYQKSKTYLDDTETLFSLIGGDWARVKFS